VAIQSPRHGFSSLLADFSFVCCSLPVVAACPAVQTFLPPPTVVACHFVRGVNLLLLGSSKDEVEMTYFALEAFDDAQQPSALHMDAWVR